MAARINRRDFLKGFAALPLVATQMSPPARALQQFANGAKNEKPNILILLFDSLSASHASLHGYGRETTPHLSRFAQSANVYHNHYAAGNFTMPGTASLLTGTYPWTHRALHFDGSVLNELAARNLFAAFDDTYYKIAYTHNQLVTMLLHQFRTGIDYWKPTRELCLLDIQYSDLLFPNDYNAASIGEWNSRGVGQAPGSFIYSLVDGAVRLMSRNILQRKHAQLFPRGLPSSINRRYFLLEDVIDWLLKELPQLPQPFLAYIHVLPPHFPYTARHDFIDIFADDDLQVEKKPSHFAHEGFDQATLNHQRRLYDEYIAFTDAELGRFFDNIQRGGLLDNSMMVVTSDHGELFERGIFGHNTPALYQPLVHIPLLIKRPGQTEGQDIRVATSCIDVLPTLMTESGQPVPTWCEGEVLPGIANIGQKNDRPIFSVEAKSNPKRASLNTATIAMIKGSFKLIHNRGYGDNVDAYELYDLSQDPEELNNLYAVQQEIGQTMSEELGTFIIQDMRHGNDKPTRRS